MLAYETGIERTNAVIPRTADKQMEITAIHIGRRSGRLKYILISISFGKSARVMCAPIQSGTPSCNHATDDLGLVNSARYPNICGPRTESVYRMTIGMNKLTPGDGCGA
jgi:hypothetical protein